MLTSADRRLRLGATAILPPTNCQPSDSASDARRLPSHGSGVPTGSACCGPCVDPAPGPEGPRSTAATTIVLWCASAVRPGHRPPSGGRACRLLGRAGGPFRVDHRRRQLLDGLAEAIELPAAAGCTRIWLNGSFVTAKDKPADFDACWDPDGVDLDALEPIFSDFANARANQKVRFGGELFPNVTETGSGLVFADFFKNERDGGRKGIVVLTIGGRS